MRQLPKSLFISHGGGPLPLLGDPGHSEMVSCLQGIAAAIPKPDALVVVSAHWEETTPTITAGRSPALIYDYYGFPPESYDIRYPCVGEPSLAIDIQRMLGDCGIAAQLDENRGFDHGVFVPLKIMYPEADIPCVQLSLVSTLDASFHIDIGAALQGLKRQNVLVIGSGFSFHNLKDFFAPESTKSRQLNHSFEQWLLNVCTDDQYLEKERRDLLVGWEEAPGARFCHPREEHLLPLHVCYGRSQTRCTEQFELTIMNRKSSMYLW
ncbi:class III extradiol ring-cleavage dioxygenase [uncultured Porticoccus sp.]|uniref:DODA-type extradiol aromatic ring-opening family dioxygenase n=1 Tax=uncultured Porticoccus sp. TaxID=1256050 RepID=UPI00261A4FCC|nr:class III extradiol ring-cleavage dioxygenase [uncultured Porticoccus sp.]